MRSTGTASGRSARGIGSGGGVLGFDLHLAGAQGALDDAPGAPFTIQVFDVQDEKPAVGLDHRARLDVGEIGDHHPVRAHLAVHGAAQVRDGGVVLGHHRARGTSRVVEDEVHLKLAEGDFGLFFLLDVLFLFSVLLLLGAEEPHSRLEKRLDVAQVIHNPRHLLVLLIDAAQHQVEVRARQLLIEGGEIGLRVLHQPMRGFAEGAQGGIEGVARVEEPGQLFGGELGRVHLRFQVFEGDRFAVDEGEQLRLGVLTHLDLHQHEADVGRLVPERSGQLVHACGVALDPRAAALHVDVALEDAGDAVAQPLHRVANRFAEECTTSGRESEKSRPVGVVEVAHEAEIFRGVLGILKVIEQVAHRLRPVGAGIAGHVDVVPVPAQGQPQLERPHRAILPGRRRAGRDLVGARETQLRGRQGPSKLLGIHPQTVRGIHPLRSPRVFTPSHPRPARCGRWCRRPDLNRHVLADGGF